MGATGVNGLTGHNPPGTNLKSATRSLEKNYKSINKSKKKTYTEVSEKQSRRCQFKAQRTWTGCSENVGAGSTKTEKYIYI